MDTFPCKFEDKKSAIRGSSNINNAALNTPGKIKSQKKMMKLQNSTNSLDLANTGSNDKVKDGNNNNKEP